jgi:uncharacterized protein (TIGR03790 family)
MSPFFCGKWRQFHDALPASIEALALTWTQPYAVACLSIGIAFAVDDDEERFCSTPCQATDFLGTFNDEGHTPFTTHGVRPTMMLAANNLDEANALIARGIASDATAPVGRGFLVNTSDLARTVRAPAFPTIVNQWQGVLDLTTINADVVSDTSDVLFYFTGLANVADVDSHTWKPGAVADHLTSFGGQVPVSSQMSALRWLTAGATASYGTVVEPCNFQGKFPNPAILLNHYYRGEPIIEAYWKSVSMPGEGLFIGEPLASPWDADEIQFDPQSATLTLKTFGLTPGLAYNVLAADSVDGPFSVVQDVTIAAHQRTEITVQNARRPVYKLARAPAR